MPTINPTLDDALRFYQEKRFDDTIAVCRQILAKQPANHRALFLLGLSCLQTDRLAEADAALNSAIQLAPKIASYHNTLGAIYSAQQRYTDAIASHRRALALKSDYPEAHNNLGAALADHRRFDDAIACYREAIRLQPDYVDAWINLGNAFHKLGQFDSAADAFREALRLRPDSREARYFLAAATGVGSPPIAPAKFVVSLFDQFASTYDQNLTEKLRYRVPDLLSEAVQAVGVKDKLATLDLGCGTGLCGAQFRLISSSLVGVDLSPKMLAKAKERGIYDELIAADLAGFLENNSRRFDLILAADVFPYFGDLTAVFRDVARALRPAGLFAFTVEALEHAGKGNDYRLQSTRRFAHARPFLDRIASELGFAPMRFQLETIRMDDNVPVAGWVVLLRTRD